MMSLNLPDILANSGACLGCLYPAFLSVSHLSPVSTANYSKQGLLSRHKKVKTQMVHESSFNLNALGSTSM